MHAFLTWAVDGGEWSALLPGRFNSKESVSGTHSVEGTGYVDYCKREWGEKSDKEAYLKRKDGELSLDSICNSFH